MADKNKTNVFYEGKLGNKVIYKRQKSFTEMIQGHIEG
jgi:hypothetical protein